MWYYPLYRYFPAQTVLLLDAVIMQVGCQLQRDKLSKQETSLNKSKAGWQHWHGKLCQSFVLKDKVILLQSFFLCYLKLIQTFWSDPRFFSFLIQTLFATNANKTWDNCGLYLEKTRPWKQPIFSSVTRWFQDKQPRLKNNH